MSLQTTRPQFSALSLFVAVLSPLLARSEKPAVADELILKNARLQRCLMKEDGVWRTAWISRGDGTERQEFQSDEFRIRLLDGTEINLHHYQAVASPTVAENQIRIQYERRTGSPQTAPASITIVYEAAPEGLRKTLILEGVIEKTIDILEVERFSSSLRGSRGGRGQPVFLGDHWFVGLEHPAGHSRHTDGNCPKADSACFELVGNYSYVDLDGADIDPMPRKGLVRLFHFPVSLPSAPLQSQTAILGSFPEGLSPEQGFYEYLDQIAKRPRSFTHYNNWFDAAGKNLNSKSFTTIANAFTDAMRPYGIKLDAMVPDNGWQNIQTVWQPSPSQFPGGMNDLERLGQELKNAGAPLGLWLSLDSTTCDIRWGESQGFVKAKPNAYFAQYFPHYSLSHDKYKKVLKDQLTELIQRGQLSYFKHDFNHLSDRGEHSGHPGTDRHGHEAEVNAMLELLAHCRNVSPDIYQNLTNWVWFSPWWLMHGDALWMLAGDDGFNKNTPELSARAMATTDRDTYLWRMWGDSDCRPLVPISRLMTHGIIRNPGGQMESPQDTLVDWADHVMMYYGRGVQMKEWYITPSAMTPDHWRVLGTIHAWSDYHFDELRNVVYVGGRPDEGNVYGYFGWNVDKGVLTARNPSARPQILRIPMTQSSFLRKPTPLIGKEKSLSSQVVYPYLDPYRTFAPNCDAIEFEIPGYSTMVFEISTNEFEATPIQPPEEKPLDRIEITGNTFTLPAEELGKCEILVIGYPTAPAILINDQKQSPTRKSQGAINEFASYASAGMASESSRMWNMASYDISSHRGQTVHFDFDGFSFDEGTFEAWLVVERPRQTPSNANLQTARPLPWALLDNFRRETYPIALERKTPSISRRSLGENELRSTQRAVFIAEAFGVQGGSFGDKEIVLNGQTIGRLPTGGDTWQPFEIDLPENILRQLPLRNVLTIRHNGQADKFKFRGGRIVLQVQSGEWVTSTVQSEAQTSFKDWPYLEGMTFLDNTSHPVILEFTIE